MLKTAEIKWYCETPDGKRFDDYDAAFRHWVKGVKNAVIVCSERESAVILVDSEGRYFKAQMGEFEANKLADFHGWDAIRVEHIPHDFPEKLGDD